MNFPRAFLCFSNNRIFVFKLKPNNKYTNTCIQYIFIDIGSTIRCKYLLCWMWCDIYYIDKVFPFKRKMEMWNLFESIKWKFFFLKNRTKWRHGKIQYSVEKVVENWKIKSLLLATHRLPVCYLTRIKDHYFVEFFFCQILLDGIQLTEHNTKNEFTSSQPFNENNNNKHKN